MIRPILFLFCLLQFRGPSPAASAQPWHEEKYYRWKELPAHQPAAGPLFTELFPKDTGLYFTNLLSEEAIARNRVLANGSGIAIGDVDKDGFPDIFMAALESRAGLFHNRGDWRFEEATKKWLLPADLNPSTGTAFADLNGDSWLDLLVATSHRGLRIFHNQGGKSFLETRSGAEANPAGTTMALADIDGNGTIDLYVTNYRTNDIRDRGRVLLSNAGGKPAIPHEFKERLLLRGTQVLEYGVPDQLYLNDGHGIFKPVSWTNGAFMDFQGNPVPSPPRDWGLGASFRDINGDGAPDLYVCNDYWTPDRFWINQGHGRFRLAAPLVLRKIPSNSMGADFSDIDRDGDLDFLVVEMLSRDRRAQKRQIIPGFQTPPAIGVNPDLPEVFHNTLFLNRGDHTFAEISHYAGLQATDWSWSPVFLDADLDGYEDLFVTAGHHRDVQDLDTEAAIRKKNLSWDGFPTEAARQEAYTRAMLEHNRLYPFLKFPVRAYKNLGNARFAEVSSDWGFLTPKVHHAIAMGDLDADGDLDLVVNALNGPVELYKNESGPNKVAIRLQGKAPNTQAIGAKLLLTTANLQQSKEITAGGTYLSSHEPLTIFALPVTTGVPPSTTLQITWRSGQTTTVENIQAGRLYEISESSAQLASAPPAPALPRPLFTEVTLRAGFVHPENAFNDYNRQPLLPFKLSQAGPALCLFDLNADGQEDLIMGAGADALPALFLSDGKGNFRKAIAHTNLSSPGDYLGIVGFQSPLGPELIAAKSGYESPQKEPLLRLQFKDGELIRAGTIPVPASHTSAHSLAIGVIGSKQPALYVAGGVQAGKYPQPAPSALLLWQSGQWKFDSELTEAIRTTEIINAAVWADLTGDGSSELILACEWGPIRIFQFASGTASEITGQLGLANVTGLWKSVAVADLDGDGRLDLAAGNWGENSCYEASAKEPLVLAYGELFNSRRLDLIETVWQEGALAPRRQLADLADSLPFIHQNINNHREYCEAALPKILGERHTSLKHASANTLASTIFLNRPAGFLAEPLPTEAQLAPVFGIASADFTGDGRPDIFLAQNFFQMHPHYPRQDAGRGLLLVNEGNHARRGEPAFSPLSPRGSAIILNGEQRAAVTADFNNDGRIDLAVAQNGSHTRIYENSGANPAARIRLLGPLENTQALGAQLWFESPSGHSPVQEIQSTSSYLSQSTGTKHLRIPSDGTLHVRWAGGEVSSQYVGVKTRFVEIKHPSLP